MAARDYLVLSLTGATLGSTALLVQEPDLAAVGKDVEQALSSLAELLSWLRGEPGLLGAPEIESAELRTFSVKVRPQLHHQGSFYPYEQEIAVKLTGVVGRHRNQGSFCSLPQLELFFFYQQKRALTRLVRYYATEKLLGLNPSELGRLLTPAEAELHFLATESSGESVTAGTELSELEKVADPLSEPTLRHSLGRPYERDEEVRRCLERLEHGHNLLLIGQAGAGKTTLVAEVGRRWKKKTGHDLWLTRAARLVAGLPYLGQWEQRCEALVRELFNSDGLLVVENLLDLVTTGGGGSQTSLAAFLATYLERKELQLVGEARPSELDAIRRMLPGLLENFELLWLPTLSEAQALRVLRHVAKARGSARKVSCLGTTLEVVYHLHRRFLPYNTFPGVTVTFLNNLVQRAPERSRLSPNQAIDAFSQATGLPQNLLRDDATMQHAEVVAQLSASVVGQPEACEAVADVVITFKAGLCPNDRPLGVLLFCGPTGVGKTELAKALAQLLFGDSERLVRQDMAEFQGPGAAHRLVGEGHKPGPLIRSLRSQPLSVVLFDEIEKAEPEVFDLLLSILDQGLLLDSYGRSTSFRSSIVILTSNLGADSLRPIGLANKNPNTYEGEIRKFFRPEFFNRLDRIVSFNSLEPEQIEYLAGKELEKLCARPGLAQRGLKLSWQPAVVAYLARKGYDRRYGARPLQRVVEQEVVSLLARLLVERHDLRNTGVELLLADGSLDISAN